MSGNCGTDWNPRPTSSNAFFQVQQEEHSASKRLTKLEQENASRSLPAVPACCCPRTTLWSSIQQGKLEQTWIHSHSAARTSSRTMKVGKCSHLNVHSVLCYHTTLRPKSKFRLIKCLGVISLWLRLCTWRLGGCHKLPSIVIFGASRNACFAKKDTFEKGVFRAISTCLLKLCSSFLLSSEILTYNLCCSPKKGGHVRESHP